VPHARSARSLNAHYLNIIWFYSPEGGPVKVVDLTLIEVLRSFLWPPIGRPPTLSNTVQRTAQREETAMTLTNSASTTDPVAGDMGRDMAW